MNLVRKFRSLSFGERILLLQTLLVVAFLRLALCLVPFVRLKEYMAHHAARHPIRQDIPLERVVWAVRTAAAWDRTGLSRKCEKSRTSRERSEEKHAESCR
jgi:hypothetical protein